MKISIGRWQLGQKQGISRLRQLLSEELFLEEVEAEIQQGRGNITLNLRVMSLSVMIPKVLLLTPDDMRSFFPSQNCLSSLKKPEVVKG